MFIILYRSSIFLARIPKRIIVVAHLFLSGRFYQPPLRFLHGSLTPHYRFAGIRVRVHEIIPREKRTRECQLEQYNIIYTRYNTQCNIILCIRFIHPCTRPALQQLMLLPLCIRKTDLHCTARVPRLSALCTVYISVLDSSVCTIKSRSLMRARHVFFVKENTDTHKTRSPIRSCILYR